MNYLLNFALLKNHYFALRHGESMANVEGLIVSTPENGIPKYGLSNEGRAQVTQSVTRVLDKNDLDANTRIISSDFKRAHESAKIAKELLASAHSIELDAKLRERDFGDFELMDNTHYQTVWDNDAIDSSHTIDNAESADAVMQRATAVVASLEKQFNGETFLLVAHGDTLQILQAAFKKYPASKQREMVHLETAEIRVLHLL
ncbi:MAG: histidine phosphatase family protein [Cocleimonas sp.]|nr:histidine phosphatase family protein [Cocleimonas sp.]